MEEKPAHQDPGVPELLLRNQVLGELGRLGVIVNRGSRLTEVSVLGSKGWDLPPPPLLSSRSWGGKSCVCQA